MNSTLNPDNEPLDPNCGDGGRPEGDTLGPSDSSDSGSAARGAKRRPFDIDSELDAHALERGEAAGAAGADRAGTGERASADGDAGLVDNADIEPDRTDRLVDEGDGVDDPEPAENPPDGQAEARRR
ncbi:MAG: chemotaxis protein [Burkholderia sp.]